MKATAPFQYYGAKNKLAPWIAGFLTPHRVYVEPFAGSAAVLFTKAPSQVEIINDLDDEIVTFFRVLRDQPDRLIEALRLTPYSRSEYRYAWTAATPWSDVERARRYFVRANTSYNGQSGKRAGYSASARAANGTVREKARANMMNKVDRLHVVAERLRRVEIENTDALALIQRWDAPDVSLYCDPPYDSTARKTLGNYGRTDVDSTQWHADLLRALDRFRGQVILSGYDSELYASALGPLWTAHRRDVATSTNNTSGRDMRRTEVVWVKDREPCES